MQHNEIRMYVGPSNAITGSTFNKSGLEMRSLALLISFVPSGHIITEDCRDDQIMKNNSGGKMQLEMC